MALSLSELRDEALDWVGERVGAGQVGDEDPPPPEGHSHLSWEGTRESIRHLCAQVNELLSDPPGKDTPEYESHRQTCASCEHRLRTFCMSMRERNGGRGPRSH